MYERSTVLIAEDTQEDIVLLRLAFEKAGIDASLQVVRDGQEAIWYLSGAEGYEDRRRYPLPHLFLLDIKIPVLDGFEVLAWRRGHPEAQLIPVVAFSSSVLVHEMETLLRLGANAFVEKPAGLYQLTETAAAIGRFWLGHHGRLSVPARSKSRLAY